MLYLIPRPVLFLIIFTQKLDLIIWAKANEEVRELIAGCPKLKEHVDLPQDVKRMYVIMYSEYLVAFRGTVDVSAFNSGKSTLELVIDGVDDDFYPDFAEYNEFDDNVNDEYYDDYDERFRPPYMR